MNIFVTDNTGHFGGVYLWMLEVEEKDKTYKVIKAYKYIGNGNFSESGSIYLLRFYPKQDRRVFTNFEDARNKAVETLKSFIAMQEKKIKEDNAKIETWMS